MTTIKPKFSGFCKDCTFIGTLIVYGRIADVYLSCERTGNKFVLVYANHQAGDTTTTDDLTPYLCEKD